MDKRKEKAFHKQMKGSSAILVIWEMLNKATEDIISHPWD